MNVKARVIGVVHGMEVETRDIGAMHGANVKARVIRAVRGGAVVTGVAVSNHLPLQHGWSDSLRCHTQF
jgi:hypothetical protein